MPADGGEPRALTQPRHGAVARRRGRPTARPIYFLAADPRDRRRTRARSRCATMSSPFDENYKQRHLWKVDRRHRRRNADDDRRRRRSSSTACRADGTRIAVQRAPSPLAGDAYRGEVWVMDANGANARALTQQQRRGNRRRALARQRAGAVPRRHERAVRAVLQHQRCSSCRPPAARRAPLLPDFTYAFEQAAWAPDGNSILAVVNMGVHSELFRDRRRVAARAPADRRRALHPARRLDGWSPSAGTDACSSSTSRRGSATSGRCRSPAAGAARSVTHAFDALERDFALPRQEKVEWKGADGTTIEGCCSIRSATSRARGIRSSCRCTAGRWSPTSSAPARACC